MKRSRGRGRKPMNYSHRAIDSSGPDVKIRGTAAHIFEKYQALARDANSAGDRIGAENYLQHAEHYFRILRASQNGQVQPAAAPPEHEPRPVDAMPAFLGNGAAEPPAPPAPQGDNGDGGPRPDSHGQMRMSGRRRRQRRGHHGNGPRRPQGPDDKADSDDEAPGSGGIVVQ